MAKEISLICLFGINGDLFLRDFQPLTRFLFRMGQLRIACSNRSDNNSYETRWRCSYWSWNRSRTNQLYRNLLFVYYLQSAVARRSSVPMKERIKRFIKAVEFFQNGLIDADFISPLKARVSHLVQSLVVIKLTIGI